MGSGAQAVAPSWRKPVAGKLRILSGTIALTAIIGVFPGLIATADAAGKGGKSSGGSDTTAPSVTISTPTASTTVSGQVSVAGSSSDNVGVTAVSVSVDGGTWNAASGTTSWSWSWASSSVANGSHTLTVRASDAAGNASTKAVSVNVSNATADTTAPTVSISAPAASSTVSGTVSVTGSSSDNASVSKVEMNVDGGAWQTASGTSSWSSSWATGSYANGSHTINVRATDGAGNATSTSRSVTVSNSTSDTTAPSVSISSPAASAVVGGSVTVAGTAADNASVSKVQVQVDGGGWMAASGTTSWSVAWDSTAVRDGSHTLTARATDASGNTSTTSVTVTSENYSDTPPSTQGKWISPEGVTITINSAGPWTLSQIYSILKANALDLDKIGPTYTINVQDSSASQTQSNAVSGSGGTYTGFSATTTLQGVNSGFASRPDDVLTHEYGHAWSTYWYYTKHSADWSSYEGARWTTSDGSTTLATDSRTNSSYGWQVSEIVADDYRLLFGSSAAVSERPTHMNNQIPDPTTVTGLKSFLLNTWA